MSDAGPRSWRAAIVAVAGIAGAAGVALAAVAAHKVRSPGLASASTLLLIHALGAVANTAHARTARKPALWLMVASGMLAGACLFAADVALLTLSGTRLFAMAAPTGGTTMMIAWAALGVVAVADRH